MLTVEMGHDPQPTAWNSKNFLLCKIICAKARGHLSEKFKEFMFELTTTAVIFLVRTASINDPKSCM